MDIFPIVSVSFVDRMFVECGVVNNWEGVRSWYCCHSVMVVESVTNALSVWCQFGGLYVTWPEQVKGGKLRRGTRGYWLTMVSVNYATMLYIYVSSTHNVVKLNLKSSRGLVLVFHFPDATWEYLKALINILWDLPLYVMMTICCCWGIND